MKKPANLNHYSNKPRFSLLRLDHKKRLFVLCFGIIGFVLPTLYGFIEGFPIPYVQDEFSNILAADTFAGGRLTNPTPQFAEHFESPHIIVTPSYMSKYPPMQSLFLAAGQVLFGHPAFGVWLSCGAAAAALFWMLLAWTRMRWAIFGTLLFILLIGINSYWAQSYIGGMVAAAGGSLFFGAFRRLFDKQSGGITSLMILGGVISVNSRPFEGTLTMLPALVVLFVWLWRDKSITWIKKFSQIVLPGAAIAAISLSAMFYYNFRITGNIFNLPYTEHQRQYYPTPLFIFQSKDETATKGNKRLRKVYEEWKSPQILKSLISIFNLPDSIYWSPLFAFPYLIFFVPYFLFSLPLMLIFYVAIPFLIHKSKWLSFTLATILFTFALMSFATWWDNYHYSAPLTSCFFLLMVESFRHFTALIEKEKKKFQKHLIVVLLILLSVGSVLWSQIYPAQEILFGNILIHKNTLMTDENNSANKHSILDEPTILTIPIKAAFLKNDIEEFVQKLPDKYIAIVFYANDYTFHDEIVYNRADIENSKIIWAHDLGTEKNRDLLDYYKNRKVLLVKISGSTFEINPLP